MAHPTVEELQVGLAIIRAASKERGVLDLIVRRPAVGVREVLETGELDLAVGLVGDTWKDRGSSRSADGARGAYARPVAAGRGSALRGSGPERRDAMVQASARLVNRVAT